MLYLYLAVLGTALYWVTKNLLPEMLKPPVKTAPRRIIAPATVSQIPQTTNGLEFRVNKLEMLLAEKNRNIDLLQKELKIFHTKVINFDKIKSLLEEEIQRLREQNRIFRSELGLPAAAAEPKVDSIA